MHVVAGFLMLIGFVALILGLINPRIMLPKSPNPTRGKILAAVAVMWVIGIGILAATADDAHLPDQASPAAQAAADNKPTDRELRDQAAMDLATKAIGGLKRQANWRTIKIREATDRSFALDLDYATPPGNLVEVALDTKAVARAILAALVAGGRKPATEGINVFVFAERTGIKGETGQDLVAAYGRTTYDYNNDQLEFKPQR